MEQETPAPQQGAAAPLLPDPAAVDYQATQNARAFVDAATRPQPQTIDYEALAKQHGATSSTIDYDALAQQHGAIQGPTQPESAMSRFGHGLYESTVGPVVQAVTHPVDAMIGSAKVGIGLPQLEEIAQHVKNRDYGKAAVAAGRWFWEGPEGRAGKAIVHGTVDPIAQDVKEGNYAGAGGRVTGNAAAIFGPKVLGKGMGLVRGAEAAEAPFGIKYQPRSAVNPVQAAAIGTARGEGLPVNLPMATQNKFFQGVQNILEKQPATAGRMADSRNAAEAALSGKIGEAAESVAPGGARTKLTAGTNVQRGIEQRLTELKGVADQSYSKLREIAAKPENTVPVQVGEKVSAIVGPDGRPISQPVFEHQSGPTSYARVKQSVQPLLKVLEKQIPEAQKQASPGLSVLRQIMQRPDSVDLNTAISDLSAIQNLSRTELPQVRSNSQGIAAFAVKPLRAAIDHAAANMGPEATQALEAGRTATKTKAALAQSFRSQLKANPVQLVNRLLANEDAGLKTLRTVQENAPETIPDIGRSALERILDHATAKGGYRNVDSALNMWNKIGPETKALLYGPELTKRLDGLFNYGKMLGDNPNPSGSASVGSLTAAGAAMATHPMGTLAMMFSSRKLAGLLMQPNGPELAAKGITFDLAKPLGRVQALRLIGPQMNQLQQTEAPSQR